MVHSMIKPLRCDNPTMESPARSIANAWVIVDRNLVTPRGAYAFLEDVSGDITPGDVVHVRERHGGALGGALVTAIEDGIVYLSLAWHTLHHVYSRRGRHLTEGVAGPPVDGGHERSGDV